ncbi:MAG TPA: Dps family protein [Candidatus Nitrosotenuis sp.]|jgi:starvation-inducible DNA-binding protein|nr:Dps family protein [Candidatus Nitrosotenuis sp.]
MIMDIGLMKKDRKVVSDALSRVLADSFSLYLKTLNYHWNVMGPHFSQLHKLFKELYEELEDAIDSIAERIRILGFHAPANYSDYMRLTVIKEEKGHPEAFDMVRQLVLDNEYLIRRSHEVLSVAQSVADEATMDLMIKRIKSHGKRAWMLRSHLE